MTQNPKVWFVDDLPRNLRKFKENHKDHFNVKTFEKTGDVLSRIQNNEYPDALLCDIFFYDTEERAEQVEGQIDELAIILKDTATSIGANDHTHATGILLMQKIYEHFNRSPPPFPMYAYTSKGPFLLEQKEWENISKYGAEVLLKNRISPESERIEIEGDIAIAKGENSPRSRIRKICQIILCALLPGLFYLILGRWLRGTW